MVKIEVAEPKDRFVGAAIDFVPVLIVFLVLIPISTGAASLFAVIGSVYLIFRDLIGNGQSIGKRFVNLQVVDAETDRVPDPMALILRNLAFGVPGLNVVAALVEGVQALRHPQGLRFGDMFAQTGVVKVPAEDREKLLVQRGADRPSKSGGRIVNPDAVPPVGASTATPAADAPAPAPAAAKPPAAIDLPPEAPKAAAPAAAAPAAPAGPLPGVAMSDEDPLKKLIEQAGTNKPS